MDPASPPGDAPAATREFDLSSLAGTLELAASVGRVLEGGETIALVGDLGSGKTTFTKGLLSGLHMADTRSVSSPTYVLEQVHAARLTVHHYDLYRLSSADEFVALGFEERIGPGRVVVIEWADRAHAVLPPDRLLVEIRRPPGAAVAEARVIRLSGTSRAWSRKLAGLDS